MLSQQFKPALDELACGGIFTGTSSWKYPRWCGRLYDEQRHLTRGKFSEAEFERECLAEYAQTFSTACLDDRKLIAVQMAHAVVEVCQTVERWEQNRPACKHPVSPDSRLEKCPTVFAWREAGRGAKLSAEGGLVVEAALECDVRQRFVRGAKCQGGGLDTRLGQELAWCERQLKEQRKDVA